MANVQPPPAPSALASPKPPSSTRRDASAWSHTPTTLALFWLIVSFPFIVWDTAYVLGRPHTMEGGSIYWPLWVPYKLYGSVDYIYGWKAFNAHNGFTGAQSLLNAVETALYAWYLRAYFAQAPVASTGTRALGGRAGSKALLIAFSAAVMTFSKTALYWAVEYFNGFADIRHNSLRNLVFLWIIPNGAWLVGSAYLIWTMGGDLLDGLELASSHAKSE